MSRGGSLDALTGLRFFAALHVVLFHFARPVLDPAPEWLRSLVGSGYSAVGVFFVLSGFVLAWNYLDTDGRMETGTRAFLAARVARVYPVYLLTFLLSAPPTVLASVVDNGWKVAVMKLAVAAVAALTLLQAWTPRLALYWNPRAGPWRWRRSSTRSSPGWRGGCLGCGPRGCRGCSRGCGCSG